MISCFSSATMKTHKIILKGRYWLNNIPQLRRNARMVWEHATNSLFLQLVRRTDGATTVNTCVYVIMVGSVTACQGRVCVHLATTVQRVKTGVLLEPTEVDVNTHVCVSTAPTVNMTLGHVCVPQDTLAHTASEVRPHCINGKAACLYQFKDSFRTKKFQFF